MQNCESPSWNDSRNVPCFSVRDAVALLLCVVWLAACDSPTNGPAANLTPSSSVGITLSSPAFTANSPIPRDYTCEGANGSPALQWTDPPASTRSLALILEDPDAPNGTFIHWLVYDIPASTRSLSEAQPTTPDLPDGSKQGTNSSGKVGYGGPCPPNGTHHYHFELYALDMMPSLTAGVSVSQLRSAMSGHVLAEGELVGTYSR